MIELSRPRPEEIPTPSSGSGHDARAVPAAADEWLRRARRGEGPGFDGLYRWLAGPIRGFAAARGAAEPDDVVNDVFLKAFRALDSFDGDATSFRSWMFTTTRNHLVDLHRRAARRPQRADGIVVEQSSPVEHDPALAAVGNDRVAALLSSLTESQREVIVLRVIADLSLEEVAEIVGRRVTAVKRLQARGLRSLQQRILDEEVSP